MWVACSCLPGGCGSRGSSSSSTAAAEGRQTNCVCERDITSTGCTAGVTQGCHAKGCHTRASQSTVGTCFSTSTFSRRNKKGRSTPWRRSTSCCRESTRHRCKSTHTLLEWLRHGSARCWSDAGTEACAVGAAKRMSACCWGSAGTGALTVEEAQAHECALLGKRRHGSMHC